MVVSPAAAAADNVVLEFEPAPLPGSPIVPQGESGYAPATAALLQPVSSYPAVVQPAGLVAEPFHVASVATICCPLGARSIWSLAIAPPGPALEFVASIAITLRPWTRYGATSTTCEVRQASAPDEDETCVPLTYVTWRSSTLMRRRAAETAARSATSNVFRRETVPAAPLEFEPGVVQIQLAPVSDGGVRPAGTSTCVSTLPPATAAYCSGGSSLLAPFDASLRAGRTYVESSEYVRPTFWPGRLAAAKCRRVKPPTSLPKSSDTYAPGPSVVACPCSTPSGEPTAPPLPNTATGCTVRLAGDRLNASHGPGGAAA